MKKENILFTVCGILFGFIGGFFFANHYNRSAITSAVVNQTAQQAPAPFADTPSQSSAPNIQPNQNLSVPMPFIQQTIDKAKAEPQNLEAQIAAGDLFYKIQRFQEAIPFYQKALEIKTDNVEVLTKIANAYFDGNNFIEARQYYARVLEKNPNDVNVRTDYGLTFYLQPSPDAARAIQEYKQSLQINPNHELTLQNLAVAQSNIQDLNALRETLARLEKVNPANPVISELRSRNSL